MAKELYAGMFFSVMAISIAVWASMKMAVILVIQAKDCAILFVIGAGMSNVAKQRGVYPFSNAVMACVSKVQRSVCRHCKMKQSHQRSPKKMSRQLSQLLLSPHR